jgi:hypothetical protein
MPDSVTRIDTSVFYKCSSLTSIIIPESVTSIGSNAFASCSSLADLTCLPVTPPSLGSDAFLGTPAELIISVPEDSVGLYKTATNWIAYQDVIQAKEEEE